MDAQNPLLTVIIPTLNEERYLPILLDSIAKQTFRDFEIIVADSPKTTDRTREIALAHGARVVEGGRPSAGRNAGAAAARGRVFLFFDADVVLPNERFLEDTVREFVARGLDVATCRVSALSERFDDKLFYNFYNVYSLALERVLPHAQGFCIYAKRSLHEAINGFDQEIRLAEDHEYARRGAHIGSFGFLKSQYIPVSMRRFERDGRLKTVTKYVLAEAYMLAMGPIKSDIFNYQWGHGKDREN